MVKRILIAIVIIIIGLGAAFAYTAQRTLNDQYGQPVLMNQDGAKKALIVYYPGASSAQKRVITSFANGLVDNDWRVDIYYANNEAPTPEGYDLLVIGTPCYGQQPAPSMTRYLERIGTLDGIDTVAIASAAGTSGIGVLVDDITQRGGNVVLEQEVLTMDPDVKLAEWEQIVFDAARNLSN